MHDFFPFLRGRIPNRDFAGYEPNAGPHQPLRARPRSRPGAPRPPEIISPKVLHNNHHQMPLEHLPATFENMSMSGLVTKRMLPTGPGVSNSKKPLYKNRPRGCKRSCDKRRQSCNKTCRCKPFRMWSTTNDKSNSLARVQVAEATLSAEYAMRIRNSDERVARDMRRLQEELRQGEARYVENVQQETQGFAENLRKEVANASLRQQAAVLGEEVNYHMTSSAQAQSALAHERTLMQERFAEQAERWQAHLDEVVEDGRAALNESLISANKGMI